MVFAMSATVEAIRLNALRTETGLVRERVYLKGETVRVESYGSQTALLVPAPRTVEGIVERVQIRGFRASLATLWEKLHRREIDAVEIVSRQSTIAYMIRGEGA